MIAMLYAIVGCVMIGVHFESALVAIGIYCCIIAVANWERT